MERWKKVEMPVSTCTDESVESDNLDLGAITALVDKVIELPHFPHSCKCMLKQVFETCMNKMYITAASCTIGNGRAFMGVLFLRIRSCCGVEYVECFISIATLTFDDFPWPKNVNWAMTCQEDCARHVFLKTILFLGFSRYVRLPSQVLIRNPCKVILRNWIWVWRPKTKLSNHCRNRGFLPFLNVFGHLLSQHHNLILISVS